jgi:hypothetical protein
MALSWRAERHVRQPKAVPLTRQLPNFRPNFRPSKLTAIAVGGAFCLAAAGSVSAVALSSSTHGSPAAAGLTSETTQVEQRAMVATMAQAASTAAKAAAAKAAAEKAAAAKAAQEHAAHTAHQQHAQILAQRAAAAKAAAAKAAAEKAAAAKAAAVKAAAEKAAAAKTVQQQAATVAATSSGSPQQIAQGLLAQDGMSGQFSCLDSLWQRESGWSVSASNASSGAYGIPQALPGSKMASVGPDWQTSAETQIKWGLQYIDSTYGSPCGAWSHEESSGWY